MKIDKLVSDNISLITIEHLNELAKEIDEENIRQLNNAKDEMAIALKMKKNSEKSETFYDVKSINISSACCKLIAKSGFLSETLIKESFL